MKLTRDNLLAMLEGRRSDAEWARLVAALRALPPTTFSDIAEQVVKGGYSVTGDGNVFGDHNLATGQKFENLPPDSNIEALEVSH